MEQIVNKPIAGTFRWLHMGGTKIELPEKTETVQYTVPAGESRIVTLEDGDVSYRVEAELEENSQLELILLRKAGQPELTYNDIQVRCGDHATFHWYRIVTDGKKTFDNCSVLLEGEGSRFESDIAYRLKGSEKYDLNCEGIHTGKKTETAINASGVLSDQASKLMRGTIDFRQGCAGAVGNESEDVLLIDETVQNQSVPVILCAEEDVEGNHGASIGRPDENLIYYMASRGIETERILEMLAQAKLDTVIQKLPDEEVRARFQKDGEEA